MGKIFPVGKLYSVNQTNIYWRFYYKIFGSSFIHYHVCFRYLRKYFENIKVNIKIVDFGCGDGTYLNQLALENDVNGYGIEKNPDRLPLARKVATFYGLKNTFECRDITVPGTSSDKYDYGICLDVLEHLDEAEVKRAFETFSSYIKNDGILIIRVPHDEDKKYLGLKQNFTYSMDDHKKAGFTIRELKELFENVGFKIEKVTYQFYFLAQINYEVSEAIRRFSKFLYSIYSVVFRWVSFIEIFSSVFNLGRANGVMVVARKLK